MSAPPPAKPNPISISNLLSEENEKPPPSSSITPASVSGSSSSSSSQLPSLTTTTTASATSSSPSSSSPSPSSSSNPRRYDHGYNHDRRDGRQEGHEAEAGEREREKEEEEEILPRNSSESTTSTTIVANLSLGQAVQDALGGAENLDRYPPSMTESVRDHVFEGGLRYHAYKSGKYAFPNDEIEQNRDDMKHAMSLMLCQGEHFYSPVKDVLERGGEVLDLGTGTGIWAIELGDKYPNSKFIGTDLSPIQPNLVPENVHFYVDDFEEEWVDPINKYDFIHIRHTMHSVHNPQLLLQRAMQHLKPGGYIEIQEIEVRPQSDDGSINPSTPYALRDYINFMSQGLRAMGSEMHTIIHLPQLMKSVGFEDVQVVTHKAPLGSWPKDKRLRLCGFFMQTAIMDGLRGISHRPLTALGWTQLQIEMVLVDVRKAVMDSKVHAYFTYHVLYGRKPLEVSGDEEGA